MIIKFTLNDNDFTHYIELFLKEPLFCRTYEYAKHLQAELNRDDKNYYSKYKEISLETERFKGLLWKCMENTISKEEQKYFLEYLKKIFLYYIKSTKNSDDYKYIEDNINIRLNKTISDKWQNDEIVYYFISCEKYITL